MMRCETFRKSLALVGAGEAGLQPEAGAADYGGPVRAGRNRGPWSGGAM